MKTKIYDFIYQTVTGGNTAKTGTEESLIAIVNDLDKGNFTSVIAACEIVMNSGSADIRIIIFYIYSSMACFTKDGTIELFQLLSLLIKENFEVLQPEKNRFEEIDKSFAWLFRKMERKLVFLEKKNKAELEEWYDQFDNESLTLIKNNSADFIDIMDEMYTETPFNARPFIIKFTDRIKKIKIPLDVPFEDIDEEEEVHIEALISEEPKNEKPSAYNDEKKSFALMMLEKKLKCFEELIQNGDYIKAAVVSTDLFKIIENFDPRQFFPEMFKSFLSDQIRYTGNLQQLQNQTNPEMVQAIIDLYHSDIDEFITIEINKVN